MTFPRRGEIGVFNRSYYEDVLVVKVHPELLDNQQFPPVKRGEKFWNARYEDINAFEQPPRAERHAHPEIFPSYIKR